MTSCSYKVWVLSICTYQNETDQSNTPMQLPALHNDIWTQKYDFVKESSLFYRLPHLLSVIFSCLIVVVFIASFILKYFIYSIKSENSFFYKSGHNWQNYPSLLDTERGVLKRPCVRQAIEQPPTVKATWIL